MNLRGAAWPAWWQGVWCGLVVWTSLWQVPGFLASLRPPRNDPVDFFQEWASARNYLEGRPTYEPHESSVLRYLGFHLPPGRELIIKVNAHPPTAVLLALPLALLDYPVAFVLWTVLTLAALALSLWLMERTLQPQVTPVAMVLAVVLLLLGDPIREHLEEGQWGIFLMLLVVGAWIADRAGRSVVAGICLGTATAIKLFPALLFLYFLARRRFRVALAGLVTLAALTALTVIVLGLQSYQSYIQDVLPELRQFRSAWHNISVPALWHKLFDPVARERIIPLWSSPATARVGAAISAAGLISILAWLAWRSQTPRTDDVLFGVSLTALVLVSPISWGHSLVLLLPALLILWTRLPAGAPARWLLALIAVVFWMDPITVLSAFLEGGREYGVVGPAVVLTWLSLKCYALAALFVLGVGLCVRKPKSQDLSLACG